MELGSINILDSNFSNALKNFKVSGKFPTPDHSGNGRVRRTIQAACLVLDEGLDVRVAGEAAKYLGRDLVEFDLDNNPGQFLAAAEMSSSLPVVLLVHASGSKEEVNSVLQGHPELFTGSSARCLFLFTSHSVWPRWPGVRTRQLFDHHVEDLAKEFRTPLEILMGRG